MTNNEHFFLFRYRIFLRFVLNHIVFGDEYKTTRQDIYDAYMEYCKDCKELIMCKNTFFSNFKRDVKSLSGGESFKAALSASTANFFGKRKFLAYPSDTLQSSPFLPLPFTSCNNTTFIFFTLPPPYVRCGQI